jgi:hypothetical protein
MGPSPNNSPLKIIDSQPLIQVHPASELKIVDSQPLPNSDQESEAAKYFRIGAHILGAPVEGLIDIPKQLFDWAKGGFKAPVPHARQVLDAMAGKGTMPQSLPMGFDEPVINAVGDAVAAVTPTAVEGVKASVPYVKGAVTGAAKAVPGALETSILKYTGVPQVVRGAINGARAAGSAGPAAVPYDAAQGVRVFPAPPAPTPTPPAFDPGAPVEFTPAPQGPLVPAASPASGTGSPYTPPSMDPGVTVSRVPADQMPIAPRNPLNPAMAKAVAEYIQQRGGTVPPDVMANLTRESAAPVAQPDPAPQNSPAEQLRPLMESVPAPMRKAVADANYRAVKEGAADPSTAGPAYEAAARADKVQNLADAADGVGVSYSQLAKLPKSQLTAKIQDMAKAIGENDFSNISVEHFMDLMRKKGK